MSFKLVKISVNFLGKDYIRYENTVEVELPVYKAILQFQAGQEIIFCNSMIGTATSFA